MDQREEGTRRLDRARGGTAWAVVRSGYPAAPASCWTGSGRRYGSSSQPSAGRSPGTSPEGLRNGDRRRAGERTGELAKKQGLGQEAPTS